MRLLALAHSLQFSGAQISTLEFLELLGDTIELKIGVCKNVKDDFKKNSEVLRLEYKTIPCQMRINLPEMSIDYIESWIKWADIVWITDIEFLAASKIKSIKNVPVVVHLRSYPLLCPWWGLLYGMNDVCYEGCSLRRIVKCKRLFNRELSKLGIINRVRGVFYEVLDFVKGPLDYFNWRRVVNKEILNSIDGFIAVSNFVKKVHEELLPIEGKPIEVIYNPVTYPLKYIKKLKFKKLGIDEHRDKDLVVYASGSNSVKGPYLLLQALKMLLDEGHDIKLLMFGCRGTWVEGYMVRLGVERNVVCMGKESFDVLYDAMFRAKAVVMPSIWPEPFGRVPVEANRLGTLAVVTNRGGLPETIIHGETGFVTEVSPESLALGIKQAMKSRNEGEYVRNISLSKINPRDSVNALLKFFESMMR